MGFLRGLVLRPGGEAARRDVGASPRRSLTSQVSQRPQHASVVTRSPLQPGFLARKVNSRTAQPTKVRRSMAEVLSVLPQLASSRRSREPRIAPWSFMLRQKGEKRRVRRASTVQEARSGSAQAQLEPGQPFLPSDTLFLILTQPKRRRGDARMRGHLLPELESLSKKKAAACRCSLQSSAVCLA